MRISRHAQTRSQQRRVTIDAIALALSEGQVRKTGGGKQVYRLAERQLRTLGAEFDRLRGVEVVAVGDTIVTVWKNATRRHRGMGRRLREEVRMREAVAAQEWYAA